MNDSWYLMSTYFPGTMLSISPRSSHRMVPQFDEEGTKIQRFNNLPKVIVDAGFKSSSIRLPKPGFLTTTLIKNEPFLRFFHFWSNNNKIANTYKAFPIALFILHHFILPLRLWEDTINQSCFEETGSESLVYCIIPGQYRSQDSNQAVWLQSLCS